jgi:hypothetical protein
LQGKEKRSRRSTKDLLGAFPAEVAQVVTTLRPLWKKEDPDGRAITVDLARFGQRIEEILKAHPEVDAGLLIEAGELYLKSTRQRYQAPQWFFGVGKEGEEAAWVGCVKLVLTRREQPMPEAPAREDEVMSHPEAKLITTYLKPKSVKAFDLAWDTPPKVFRKWDQLTRDYVEEPVSKGSRLEAEKNFQAIADAGVATPADLYYAFHAYITEGSGPKEGYFQALSTFYGPVKATYLQYLDRGRELAEEVA